MASLGAASRKRMVERAALDREHAPHGGLVRDVGGEAVDGFGRERDHAAGAQQA